MKISELYALLSKTVSENVDINAMDVLVEYHKELGEKRNFPVAREAVLHATNERMDFSINKETTWEILQNLFVCKCPDCSKNMTLIAATKDRDVYVGTYHCTRCLASMEIKILDISYGFL